MSQAYKRIGTSWRKSRGIHAKVRRREKGKAKMPTVGYMAPKELRHLHPSGLKEFLVFSVDDLQKIEPKSEAVKIAHTVGKRKRQEILKKAEELKIKILNP